MHDRTTVQDVDEILPRMRPSLWNLANTPLDTTLGKRHAQKRALRVLLSIRGGIDYIISRPPEDLVELERRDIWDGPIMLRELARLELERRRLVGGLADIDRRRGQILRDLRIRGR
jgi:hypothetical protein